MFDDIPSSPLEGEMNIPGRSQNTTDISQPNFNTLDEPIKETFVSASILINDDDTKQTNFISFQLRDVRAVCSKFYHVLYPKEKSSLLKDWDLWGPLVLCTFLATCLQSSAGNQYEDGPEFAQVFVIVWIGAAIVTLNSKLLGGNLSFFQSVCVLGYCLTPIAVALLVCRVILLQSQTKVLFFLRLFTTIFGFSWSTYGELEVFIISVTL